MSQPNDGVQHRRKFIKVATATIATSALAALSSTKGHAAGRHSDPFYCAPLCLLAGTRVETEAGLVAIEKLRNGDRLRTEDGLYRPIRAVWREIYTKKNDQDWPRSVKPVLVMRDAVSKNVPSRDIYVSPKHGVYLDGYLIQAECLVNDVTIRQDRFDADVIEYYHVEFDGHHVVMAEGLPVESMLSWSDEAVASYVREHGVEPDNRTPCVPILGYDFGRRAAMGLLRHAASTFVDVRDPIQVAYDRLAERALRLVEKGAVEA